MNDKSLSPEVLPDNLRLALDDGDPRQRTRKHLRRLLDAAALTAGGIGLQACVGYGVVDPMPEPACQREDVASLASSLRVEATWHAGKIVANITVAADTGGSPEIGTFIVEGGVGTPISADTRRLSVSIALDEGATVVDLLVDVTCTDGRGSTAPSGKIRIHFDLGGSHDDDAPVASTVSPA
jgi:hypothetical protein